LAAALETANATLERALARWFELAEIAEQV
jgi:hypothetical protein